MCYQNVLSKFPLFFFFYISTFQIVNFSAFQLFYISTCLHVYISIFQFFKFSTFLRFYTSTFLLFCFSTLLLSYFKPTLSDDFFNLLLYHKFSLNLDLPVAFPEAPGCLMHPKHIQNLRSPVQRSAS